jgi:putative exosortase-associated protein (TIGR04073 family)
MQPSSKCEIARLNSSNFTLYKKRRSELMSGKKDKFMRQSTLLLAAVLMAATFGTGCANVEKKFGRGMANTFEIVRGGEFRRTMEQSMLFDSPDYAYTTGFIRGLNRTFSRTGIGIYEMVTAPFPPYDPVFTDKFSPGPVYPDNYTPGMLEDSMFATDTRVGFSGGDVAPWVPGSRFKVFDSH